MTTQYDDDRLFINLSAHRNNLSPGDIRKLLSESISDDSYKCISTPSDLTENNNDQKDFHTPHSSPPPPMDKKKKKTTFDVDFHHLQPTHTTLHNYLAPTILLIITLITYIATYINNQTPHIQNNTLPPSPTYSITKTNVKPYHGSLINHGTNGGIAGDDYWKITSGTHTIDVSGIANHQLTDLQIATYGSYVVSQRGPCICIWNQYARYETGQTIHSCIQLEAHKIKVDDKSFQAGGRQTITTPDGYIFPLDIVNGLPYLQMRKYTDKEYETLPHVIMTADIPWDPHKFDNKISNQSTWYQNQPDLHKGISNHPFDEFGDY